MSLSVGIAFLYFLITRFDINLNITWLHIRTSNIPLYLLALSAYYTSFLVRGFRWQLIAGNANVHQGDDRRLPSIWTCALLVLIGWSGNSLGWFRIGDAYRSYAFAQASQGSFSRTLGTVVAERVIDVGTVFLLLLVAIAGFGFTQERGPSFLFLLASAVLLVAGLGIVFTITVLGPRLAHLLPAWLRALYEQFHHGILRSFGRMPLVMLFSIAAWLLEVARLYLVIQALGLSLSLPLTLFVAMVNGLLSAIPFTPGGLGVVEPGIVGALLLGMPRYAAISTALLDRSISYLSVILFGTIAFFAYQTFSGIRQVTHPPLPSASESPPTSLNS